MTEELELYIEKVKTLFFSMYPGNHWESSHGYDTEDGKQICVFYNRNRKRMVHVYLNDKGILMPYFGPEK